MSWAIAVARSRAPYTPRDANVGACRRASADASVEDDPWHIPESLVIVRVEDRGEAGRVAHVLVNNPEKRNALGSAARRSWSPPSRRWPAIRLRVAVLTGAGDRSFIGGADSRRWPARRRGRGVSTRTHLACDAIRRLPVPVIARVNGYCLGAGMEIAASCDMRVGVETARFGMPEVKFGIPSGMEACLLPGLIGWARRASWSSPAR